jgi:glycosyltransferase involved in cell wall biosynthesis
MKVVILYNKFFDHDGEDRVVGGVETYLFNLAQLCNEIGFETTIYQWAKVKFTKNVYNFMVKGVPVFHLPWRERNKEIFSCACSDIDLNKDILVFGADHISVPTSNKKHISIQHGVSWDLPAKYISTRAIVKYKFFAQIIKKRAISFYKKCFENCQNTVCVDYNFLNWYRTTVCELSEKKRIWVVPNFSPIAPLKSVESRDFKKNIVKIIFARRFVEIRGTRLFAGVLKTLLLKYPDLQCTFAGEGPDENWLRNEFFNEQRVSFIKYKPEETLDVHLKHDIAVVPSIASEGTSLSVAEAMATGCPVVATATGGITNMIINGYNGILTLPDPESLREGIINLIDDSELRRRIGNRAFETARDAYSFERWKKSWEKILMDMAYVE